MNKVMSGWEPSAVSAVHQPCNLLAAVNQGVQKEEA
jgi:hypothetical protein